MGEFTLSRIRFRWVGEWAAETNYAKDDIVEFQGKVYTCLKAHDSSTYFYNELYNVDNTTIPSTDDPIWKLTIDGRQWKGAWAPSQAYSLGNIVLYRGITYICVKEHQSGINLEANLIDWRVHTLSDSWRGQWKSATAYSENDIVRYNGILWRATTAHTSSGPTAGLEASLLLWEKVAENDSWQNQWSPQARYRLHDIVRYGQNTYRCIEGHTSADTTDGLENDSDKWELVIENFNYVGNWTPGDPNADPPVPGVRYKANDLVKYGANLWVCILGHESIDVFDTDEWQLWLPGLEFEQEDWDPSTIYQRNDVVRYGGYIYRATRNNSGEVPSIQSQDSTVGAWLLMNEGFRVVAGGEWSDTGDYLVGDVVRRQGQVYVAISDNATDPNEEPADWELVIPGEKYQGEWLDSIDYAIGDIVIFDGVTYRAIRHHLSDIDTRPDNDYDRLFWAIQIIGDEGNKLRYKGDIKTFGLTEDGSSFGAKRVGIGEQGQLLSVNANDEPNWTTFGEGQKIYYVSEEGVDAPDRGDTLETPFRTVRYCADFIQTDLANRAPATILIKAGVYKEKLPIKVPRDVAVVGEELRSTIIEPLVDPDNTKTNPTYNPNLPEDPITNPKIVADPLDYRATDMFWVNNGSGIRNMTLRGKVGTLGDLNEYLTRRPTGGSYVSLDPGNGPTDQSVWIISKSCYVQNVTTFGFGCTGLKIDGALHNGGNKSIVANDFTQICSDGIGVWCTNKGLTELVSVFSYYAHIGYLSENGGKIRATNGNSSYGDYGCVAEGVDVDESPISGSIDNRNQEAIVASAFVGEQGNEILRIEYDHAGENYTSANYNIVGSGSGASVIGDEIRDGGMFNVRLQNPDDSTGTLGGQGLINVGNNAQSGDQVTIQIASNDEKTLADYEGCRIIITSGTGVGQYGYITGYTLASKILQINNERTGEIGWGHINEGFPIESALTPSTVYRIEPRVTFSPPPTAVDDTETMGVNPAIYVDAASGNGLAVVVDDQRTLQVYDGTSWSSASMSGTQTPSRIEFGAQAFVVVGSADEVHVSEDGTNWFQETLPVSQSYTGLAYGDGRWVAIANGTTAVETTDLTNYQTWNTSTVPSGSWNSLAYGAGKFVAVQSGSNDIIYADSATLTWQTASIPAFEDSTQPNYVDVTYGNGRFVAISTNREAIAYSFNGSDWYTTTMPYDTDFTKVYYSEGTFVAVAVGKGNEGKVAFSDGGYYWEEVDVTAKQYTAATRYNSQWLLFNNVDDTVVKLTKGSTAKGRVRINGSQLEQLKIWEPGSGYVQPPTMTLTDPNITELPTVDIRVGNGVLSNPSFINRGTGYKSSSTVVTVSGDGYAEIYPLGNGIRIVGMNRVPRTGANLVLDRLLWLESSQDAVVADWTDMAYGNNRFVAVSSNQFGIVSSNGLEWQQMSTDFGAIAPWIAVEYGDQTFVAVADGLAYSSWSTDGFNWNLVDMPYQLNKDLAYGTGTFVAVGAASDSVVYSVDDGRTWNTSTISASPLDWISVAFGNNVFVAVTTGSDVVATSTDGIAWSAVQLPSTGNWQKITFGNNKFVITDDTNDVVVSDDGGNTWTLYQSALPSESKWNKVVFSNNRFLALSSTQSKAASSTDGATWKSRDYPLAKTQAVAVGGQFFATINRDITARANDGTEEEVYRVLTVNNVTGSNANFNANLTVSPTFTRNEGPDHGLAVEVREKYSQVRLTGHDFLEIGTGNFEETNYPNQDLTTLAPFNEVAYGGGGRVFYASTDQDGNFRVGELFAVEQATGIVTISAEYFDLQGLSELRLGGIQVGGTGVVIREFSTDATFSADSNNVVPTQRAIKAYIERRISGGGSNASTGSLVAGTVGLGGPDRIYSVLDGEVEVQTVANVKNGIDGWLLAHTFFCDSFSGGEASDVDIRDLA